MEHEHSIIIIRKENKYLNIYDERWQMNLFPNIKGHEEKKIKEYVEDELSIPIKEIKYLMEKHHEKYSLSHKENRKYHHYFYEVIPSTLEKQEKGNFYTLEELLKDPKEKENNEDIINYIKEYYEKE